MTEDPTASQRATKGPPTRDSSSPTTPPDDGPGAVRLAKNAFLTAAYIAEHLHDDPVVLFLQTARRFNAPWLASAAKAGTRIFRRDDSLAGAVCRAVLGDNDGLAAALQRAAQRGVSDRRACRLADVATAVGNDALAHRLLESVTDRHAQSAGARARLAWHEGDMSGAVEELRGYGGGPGRLRRRMEGELRSFRGERPLLRKPTGYKPIAGRALHLVTNSLPHTGSGYAQRTQSVLAALRDEGWDVMAVTRLGYPVEVGRPLARDIDLVDGIPYRRLLPLRLAEGFHERLHQQARLLAGIVEEYRPAVLHTTTHFVNAVVVRAVAEAYGLPWVYEVRGQLADTWASTRPASARESERYRLFQEREAEAACSASAVVTLGAAMRQKLVEFGVPEERIAICGNAVGEAFLAEPRTRSEARNELGLKPAAEYVGTVTSVVPYEGLDDLLRAFALLAPERPGLKLLLVGDGIALPGLDLLARELGIQDRCIFTGRVPRDRASLYHQALDVFVVPRKDLDVTRNVTPLKPVEASASRRPVVASELPALAELVHDGATGLLVAPEDPEALAAALRRLLEDPAFADRLAAAGRAWVLEDRTWKANAAKYGEIYSSLTGGRPE